MADEQVGLSIDVESLTVGELEEVEEITGIAFGNIDWNNMNAKLMRALVFISGRRTNPDFSMDDARNVRITELFRPLEQAGDADPKLSLSVNGTG